MFDMSNAATSAPMRPFRKPRRMRKIYKRPRP